MPDIPRFSYHIYHLETPISPRSDRWLKPLPLSRHMSEGNHTENSVTYGDYFCAARSFLEKNRFEMLCMALTSRLGRAITTVDLREIRIILEKHGEFYHPARIVTVVGKQKISFVLNIAISQSGNRYTKREFLNLKKLNDGFAVSFLPQVYVFGEGTFQKNDKMGMFLGDWFEGYHEFHLSKDTSDNQLKICVWDDEKGRFFLSSEQTRLLYTQVAKIMTYYYNVETFEHISAWHHAAGDFVIRLDRGGLDVKLITVRNYAPLFQGVNDQNQSADNADTLLQALLIFFLKLSIEMRLDRIDGIGDIVWLAPWSPQTVVTGVLEGLDQKRAVPFLPDSVSSCFKTYLSVCTLDDLHELSKFLVSMLAISKPEIANLKSNLPEHVQSVYRAIKEI